MALAAIPEDASALQKLFEASADYYELTMGLPPGPAEVQNLFMQLPEGKTYEDKHVISVLTDSGKFIDVLDLIRNHPEPGTWWLGLMGRLPILEANGDGVERDQTGREVWCKGQPHPCDDASADRLASLSCVFLPLRGGKGRGSLLPESRLITASKVTKSRRSMFSATRGHFPGSLQATDRATEPAARR